MLSQDISSMQLLFFLSVCKLLLSQETLIFLFFRTNLNTLNIQVVLKIDSITFKKTINF